MAKKIVGGKPLHNQISPSAINPAIDAGQWFQQTQGTGGVGRDGSLIRQTDIVRVRNDSGADLALGSVVGLYGLALTNVEPRNPWFHGDVVDMAGETANPSRGYGVLLEPTTDGERGPCQLSGACVALVTVTDVDHWGAKLVDGQTSFSSCTGTGIAATILAKQDPDGTGLMLCWVLLLTQRCLPPQLVRKVRMTETALIQDVWYTDQPCDEYVPGTIAETIVCYAPYTPYVPYVPVASYFSNAGQFDAWTGFAATNETPWLPQSLGADLGASYSADPGAFGGTPGDFAIELPVTIGADGGFVQFTYGLFRDLAADGYGPFRFLIDGVEIFSDPDGPTASGGFEEIPVGPYALTAGAHTISFSIDSTGATDLIGVTARVDDVNIFGVE